MALTLHRQEWSNEQRHSDGQIAVALTSASAREWIDMYKTPQELFSSFKIPDITENGPKSVVVQDSQSKKVTGATGKTRIMTTDLPIITEVTKHRKIQPNIIMPASRNIFSPAMQSSSSNSQPLPAILTENGTASQHFPLSTTNGPVLYFDPTFYSYQKAGMYGSPGIFFSMQPELYTSLKLASPLGLSQNYQDVMQCNLASQDESIGLTAANTVIQNVAAVQGQMAAAHIPLCLVQDGSGKLHQLVYTVPAHLYEQYIQAAKCAMFDNASASSDRDSDSSTAPLVESNSGETKVKSIRHRKREKFYAPFASDRKKSETKLKTNDIYSSTGLKTTLDKLSRGKTPSPKANEQALCASLPKVQLPLSKVIETLEVGKTEHECSSKLTLNYSESTHSSAKQENTGILHPDISNEALEISGSVMGLEESSIVIGAGSSSENHTTKQPVDSNKKFDLVQPSTETASTVGASDIRACNSKKATERVANQERTVTNRQLSDIQQRCSQASIDAIIMPDSFFNDNPVMEELVASLKSRLEDVESNITEEDSYNWSVTEQVNGLHSHPSSPNYWSEVRISGKSSISDWGSASASMIASHVSSHDASNDYGSIISDLSCLHDDRTSVDLCSPAPLSAKSCATTDSGVSVSSSIGSVDFLDDLLEESTRYEQLEADQMQQREMCPIGVISMQSCLESDDLGSENPEVWINEKFLDSMKDNFFGCGSVFGCHEATSLMDHSSAQVDAPIQETFESDDRMNELNFLDHLIQGL